jgi:hypothetical protein
MHTFDYFLLQVKGGSIALVKDDHIFFRLSASLLDKRSAAKE